MIFRLSNFKKYLKTRQKSYNYHFAYGIQILLANLLVTSVVLGIRELGLLESLELEAFDRMIRWQASSEIDPRLLVVEITEADIKKQQKWPLADRVIAEAIEQLQKYRPSVIGLDLYRDVSQPPGREELQKALEANHVITIEQLGVVPSPPEVPPERVGFNDFLSDRDNVIRRSLLYAESDSNKYYSFALRLSLKYLARQNLNSQLSVTSEFLKIGNTKFIPLEATSGGYQMPPTEAIGWQILLKYPVENIARTVTLDRVLEGKIDPALVKDKIVLIGTTAPSIKDLVPTPYSAAKTKEHLMPGVLVHAQIASQILSEVSKSQPQFWFWNQWGEGLWLWSWSLVGGILVWRLHHPLSVGLGLTISTGNLWCICWLAFTQAGWIPLIPPTLALFATTGSVLAYKVFYSRSHDILTGLPNRVLFTKQLKQENRRYIKDRSLMAVLFLDLDRFKTINETFGHQVGDRLLISATERLKACLPPGYKLARVGGDEFAILLQSLEDISEATTMAVKLQKELTQPFFLDALDIYTTVSIGIALDKTGKDLQAEDLLRDAHTAMYRAKALGKARYEIFASPMRERAIENFQLEVDLRQAIQDGEFQLYYQPIICLGTGKISGFESLVRWISPTRGFVSPGEFIPLAEETGLIIPLGQWILQEACRQTKIWHERFPQNPSLTISINISSRQFSQADLAEQIATILSLTDLDPNSVKLEITESMVMNDVKEALILLEKLKSLGLRLSMDDFGTGYSSLSYLHRFPMDTLKIDQSFVRQMEESTEDAEIVKTIVLLGHNLSMDIVAEGIETETQMQTLRSLNCEYGQGYFFSKPLPSDSATLLLSNFPQMLK